MSRLPEAHRRFLDAALPRLAADPRVVGVAAAGSLVNGGMDEFSDLDLVIAVEPEHADAIQTERHAIAAGLGAPTPLVAAFTGEHVGEPRVLICLYGPPALHVDLKFVALPDAARRVDEVAVLSDHDGRLAATLATAESAFPRPDLQWVEDRFWVWLHYGALKVGRGELFEAADFLAFLRPQVLGPLALMRHGRLPRGVRRVETEAAPDLPALRATLATHDARSCAAALAAAADLYADLREHHATPALVRRTDAERVAREYLAWVSAR
jgi:predicted nucleotidyltransferase